jgi:hypothetical protein
MLGQPTTDCEYDSMDHKGDNWQMVDIDGDGIPDIAMSKESTSQDRMLELAGLK